MANHFQQQNIISSFPVFSSSECIAWLTVFGIQTAAIVALNVLTTIVYLKERRLRKRSMYLVINLAVADMFVAASVICQSWLLGSECDFWTIHYFSVPFFFVTFVLYVFPTASLINLLAISLERTHAAFRPLKHRLLKKNIFRAVIAAVWITSGLLAGTNVLYISRTLTLQGLANFSILYVSFSLFYLLNLVVSYSSIAIKIVCGTQFRDHGATSRKRKLTRTLFFVTVVSLLVTMPFIIFKTGFMVSYLRLSKMISLRTHTWLHYSLVCLLFTSSLVNPILYTFRIPEFRRGLFSVLHCRSQPQSAQGFPLNEI